MERNATDPDKKAAYLIYEFERRAYPLSDEGFTIGRDAACNIIVREPAVSRTHAEVKPEGDEFVLHAPGTTGTRINGDVVTAPRQLKDGDRIEVGTAELTFTRAKLPLGVSVVDRAERHPEDDILSKRETISNPILASGGHAALKKRKNTNPAVPIVVMLVLAAIAAYYYLMR